MADPENKNQFEDAEALLGPETKGQIDSLVQIYERLDKVNADNHVLYKRTVSLYEEIMRTIVNKLASKDLPEE